MRRAVADLSRELSTVSVAFSLMSENKIGGIPIIDDNGILVGIITNRDLRFCKDRNMLIRDLMTKDKLITAPEKTTLKQAEEILHEYRIEKLPIVSEKNKLVGLITYKDIMKVKNYPNSCKDDSGRLRVAAAVGVTPDMMDRIDALVKVGVDFISIDTAHGHSQGVINAVKKVNHKHQLNKKCNNCKYGDEFIHFSKMSECIKIIKRIIPSWHTCHTYIMHRPEYSISTDQGTPKVNFT